MWIAFNLMVFYVIFHATTKTGPITDFPEWLALACVVLFSWQFVYGFVAGAASSVLERLSGRFDRDLVAVAAAAERLPEAARQKCYARLLHFFILTRTASMPHSSEALMAYWTVQRFQGLRQDHAQWLCCLSRAGLGGALPWN
jgi:hypothetical protein